MNTKYIELLRSLPRWYLYLFFSKLRFWIRNCRPISAISVGIIGVHTLNATQWRLAAVDATKSVVGGKRHLLDREERITPCGARGNSDSESTPWSHIYPTNHLQGVILNLYWVHCQARFLLVLAGAWVLVASILMTFMKVMKVCN